MIARPIDWTLAIAVSLGVHGAIATMYWSARAPVPLEVEGRAGSLTIVDGGLVNSVASEGAQAVEPATVRAVEAQSAKASDAQVAHRVEAQSTMPVPVDRQRPAESVSAVSVDAVTATTRTDAVAPVVADSVTPASVEAVSVAAPVAIARTVEPDAGRAATVDVVEPAAKATQPPVEQVRPETRTERKPASSRSDTAGTRTRGEQRAAQAGDGGRSASGAAGRAAESSYASRVVARLQRAKRSPRGTRAGGTVRVRFTLDRSGRVVSASLAKRSGSAVLDSEALALVRRAAPFPPFPAAISKARLTYTVPLTYRPR
ncbi:MAG: TonB family protein [Rhodobiaceae bacterium]|nr:TonB family protein [Rhodobiaceae bacterium]MCC0041487.1 TonB family protein [Rhodobiaceae bacterium]